MLHKTDLWLGLSARQMASVSCVQAANASGEEDHQMRLRLEKYLQSERGKAWTEYRRGLPVYSIRDGVLDALTQYDVVVVGGDTGCGKTTQVRGALHYRWINKCN